MAPNIRKAAGILTVVCLGLLFSFTALADPAFSEYWTQDASGCWHVRDGSGNLVKNAWLCDDAVAANGKNIWYLIDEKGDMISAGLVQDGTGNYYSLEMNHDGYYGMLRYQSGTYTADGFSVKLSLDSSHNGSFAAIQNAEAVETLKKKYGVKKISIGNGSCVYTSSFSSSTAGKAPEQAAAGQSNAQTASSGTASGSSLSAADFKVTGSSVPGPDMISRLNSQFTHDGAIYFYYDSSSDPSRESVVKTARNITLASYKNDVIAAYGNGTAVNVSSPADTKAVRIVWQHDPNGVGKFLKSCLCYTTEDGRYSIYFGFKENGQLSFIIYYIV